jgi:hypothetical protein
VFVPGLETRNQMARRGLSGDQNALAIPHALAIPV